MAVGSEALKKKLDRFLNDSRAAFRSSGEVPTPKTLAGLEKQYRNLFSSYSKLDSDWINQNLTAAQIKAVNFLSMGLSNDEAFFGAATRYFTQDAEATAVAMANFAKSRKAYDLVKKKEKPQGEELQELVRLFGSVLGVEVTQTFVESIRTEQMGSILGYALSGLVQSHMQAWNEAPKEYKEKFKGANGKPSRDVYLSEMIRQSDKEMVFKVENDLLGSGEYRAACFINLESSAPKGGVRGRDRPDHCFVCPPRRENGQDVPGRITIGTSTSAATAESRGYSFAKAIASARALVAQKEINGKPNPYYGYEVESYCCLAGNLPTTKLDGSIEDQTAIVKMLQRGRAPSQKLLTQSQVVLLAQAQFLSFFASTEPSDFVIQNLRGINPHILGCDTFDIFLAMRQQADPRADDRTLPRWVLKQANKITSLLAQGNVAIDFEATGQNVLLPILGTLVNISKNHFKSFPIGGSQRLTSQEKELLDKFGASLLSLHERLGGTLSVRHGNLLGELREEGKRWTTESRARDRIKQDSEWANARKAPVVFDEALADTLSVIREFDKKEVVKATEAGLLACLAQKDLSRQLFSQAFKVVGISQREEGEEPGWEEAFLGEYAALIDHVLSNKRLENWEGDFVGMCDREEMVQARMRFLSRYPDHPAAPLVKATSVFTGRKGSDGNATARILERLEDKSMENACQECVAAIIDITRKGGSDELVGLLREVQKMGAPKKVASRKM